MAIVLASDFKEFLRLLYEHRVEYLLVGGYAVGYHGYPRATGDMDIWVPKERVNAEKLVRALAAFGFDVPNLSPDLFLVDQNIVRMGMPPIRIELLTDISGVTFEACYAARIVDELDGVQVNLINRDHLKQNKRASGRYKDLNDLEQLP